MVQKTIWIGLATLLMAPAVWAQNTNADAGMTETVMEEEDVRTIENNQEVMLTESGDVEEFSVDKVYTIQPGDTLWDICSLLLDDPYYWPKLWSLNEYIKNPHLIYPGNQLVFTPGTESTFPDLEIIQDVPEPTEFELVRGQRKPKPEKKEELYQELENPFGDTVVEKNIARNVGVSIRLDNDNILVPKNIKSVGRITHSGEPKKLLVYNDNIYVDFFRSDFRDDVQVGQKFFVVERIQRVDNPSGSGKIGTFYKKKAVVEVSDIRDARRGKKPVFEGRVIDADDSVQRGDEVIEYTPEIKNYVPFYTEKEIRGRIAIGDKQQNMISNNDYVFLDIGANDGLEDGLQLFVVRQGDGLDLGNDKGLPDVPVARVMIVETWDTVSTAYVVTLEQALKVGDRVTTVID